ncbi:MAG: insulinase family protein [Notoacmeibacter sp.]|nr:insulinase family protein [Notoacmeibacter sp.]MCC0033039.1 insulinase family protein [Brucellaceae bacterium]
MGVEVSRLSNGLVVATETIAHLESVTLGVWVKSGSRNERDDEHGIAHLLEHMAFKGTGSRTARKIATDIEDVGGEINAATSVETTSFYARVLKDHVPLAIELLADILTDSRFDEDELRREQHVILQEIGAAFDTPDDIVFDRFTETAFRHQTIGRSILGTPETVEGFTSDQLRSYMERQYGADRMILVAAGAVDHESFLRQAEKAFGSFRAKATAPFPPYAHYVGGDFRESRDLMDAQILLGFEGRAYHVRDFYASQILSSILGGGMSSRLFQEVREKRGLCYSIYAFHWGFSDTGVFGVHAATGKDDVAELVPVILDELRKAGDSITQEELDRARAQYRAALLMSHESPTSRASQIARQMLLFGRPVTNDELMDRLSKITTERLTDLARRLFTGSTPTVTAIGPIDGLPHHNTIVDELGPKGAERQRLAV